MSSDSRIDRREFLRGLGRNLALGVLLIGAGGLVSRPRRRNDECVSDGICRGCRVLAECGLPQALSARRTILEE